MADQVWRDCEGNSRREFLKVGTAGLLGLGLPQLLRSEARAASSDDDAPKAKAKSVIVVWLGGGPATIDMWDNKPDAPEGIRGEFKSIDTKAKGMQFTEHLPKMAAIGDKVSVVRSLYHTIPSHAPATVFMNTGNKPTASSRYPAMGSLAAKLLPVPQGVPAYVTFGGERVGAGYLGTSYNPFLVEVPNGKGGKGPQELRVRGITLPNKFTQDELSRRDELLSKFDGNLRALDQSSDVLEGLDSFHKQAIEILNSDRTKKAFDLSTETAATREMYGTSGFGMSALASRRLIEAGVRFATFSMGGWDTHSNTFKTFKDRNLPQLDAVLSALITDLDQRGLLDSTIVMCAGEFGRTPKINKNGGRDHWARSMAAVVAGGGLKRGYVHGSTDASGMAPNVDPVTPDDLSATIFRQLGIDPHSELQSGTGRPMQLFREGKVIEKLVG